ncbi:uncharacterized protein LOC125369334 [Ricinus communis]|uniref:uncharacterized protein LOC125369334 n=1 Tax=Ricinus communis TaxID=3988 RepID=UPI00201A6D25|nr:uncharacterized protein LOC125369334 [Ricinus communis]
MKAKGAGLRVVLIRLEGEMLSMAKRLDFKVTNNMAEYEACLFELEAAIVKGGRHLLVYRDSMLVIQQALKEWEVKVERLKPYVNYLKTLLSMKPLVIVKSDVPCYQGNQIMQVQMGLEEKLWFYDLKNFIEDREYPKEATAKERYRVPHHIVMDNGVKFMGETTDLLAEYKIEHHRSSPYRPQANGAVEVVNKNLKKILSKMV